MPRSISHVRTGVTATVLVVAITVAPLAPTVAAMAAPSALASAPVVYRPPVDAPVVDSFRPPDHVGQRGNVGIDYATDAGTPVRAAAGGAVAFAGPVGGSLHVVVLHPDGIRTTYAFLASVGVARGQSLVAGDVVGRAGTRLHFGARAAGDAYLDPIVLLAGGALELRLVADGPLEPESEHRERNRLLGLLKALPKVVGKVGGTALSWAADAAVALNPIPSLSDLRALGSSVVSVPIQAATAVSRWWDQRGECTSAGRSAPALPGRRLAVLVAGLASTSGAAGVAGVRTAQLGYAGDDVYRFSYRAATTAERAYGAGETQIDMAESGRRLRALLEDLGERHPGIPIDVIAHSQGGLVARSALGSSAPPGVETLVTLATPHQGADIATLGSAVAGTVVGSLAENVAEELAPITGVDIGSTSVEQLGETSSFLRRLNDQPLPPGVRVTSVAARSDFIVTSPKSRLPGAHNVVVRIGHAFQHAALPGTDEATREIALAVAGLPPTCRGFFDAMADEAVGGAITLGYDLATAALLLPGVKWLRSPAAAPVPPPVP
ncbi:MAG: peptidoglycan DD-metalloendopeptidase family protein [Acidimicrobiales bacterium]